jgi:methyl-accepting chemotaxis protein
MAGGDFTIRLAIDQKDEVGLMAKALNSMIEKMAAFMKDIIAGITILSTSSANLAAVSQQLSASAHDTAEKSAIVASAAEEMSVNFQSVSAVMEQSSSNVKIIASSTEEMASTINEIGENTEMARAISENAAQQFRLASEKMVALGDSAQKINRMTEAIHEISEHTNMMVLHASAKAERAGEAGRGFAIVANEIRALAGQTAIATIDIRQQIDEMQNTKASMAEDISSISGVIEKIAAVIGGIATAVKKRSATASEVAGTIFGAARVIDEVNHRMTLSTLAAADITRNITKIRLQANQVGDGSDQVQGSAQGLTDLAHRLQRMVERFKT